MIFNRFAAAATASAFIAGAVSCTDNLEQPAVPVGNTIITASMNSSQPATRSAIDPTEYMEGNVGILWTPDDVIGVFGVADANVPFNNMADFSAGRTQFTGNLNSAPQYAYYPWSADNDGADPSALKGKLPLTQQFDRTSGVIEGDYKFGVPRPNAENEFDFTHLFSLLHFSVNASGTGLEAETLKKIKITLPESRKLGGEFSFNAIDGSYSFTGNEQQANILTLLCTDACTLNQGTTWNGYASCAPDLKADDEIRIQVYTDKHVATFTKHIAFDFQPDAVYNFNLTLGNYASDLTITDAPATPEFSSFSFTVEANKGRILDRKVVSQNSGASVGETVISEEKMTIDGLEISGMIPYLYDFNLVPTFSVPAGVKVTVDGIEQESGVTAQDFSKPVTYTLDADGETVNYTVNVSNTGIPVVVIKQSASISNGNWEKWFGGLSVRSKSSDWAVDDEVTVYDVNGRYTMASQTAGVRLRGNSTRNFPKKPFAIKLTKKQAIGDMPKHKRWVLLANWLDNSMIRNNTAFAIAHATENAWKAGGIAQGLPWNPHGVNVALVIDGRHVGNYFLCEQIKIDSNRLNIADCYEDRVEDGLDSSYEACGYLIECDDNYDENCKFITSGRGIPFQLKDDVQQEILTQIQQKVNTIEQYLISGNYTAAYELIDINSLIDQWIVFELTMNNEYRHPKSVYLYMNGGNSKLCAGPVWDFDYQTFPNNSAITTLSSAFGGEAAPSSSTWMCSNSSVTTGYGTPSDSDAPYMWYPLLFKDATFRETLQARWEAIYPYLQGVSAEIERQNELNAKSWVENHAMWPLTFRRSSIIGWAPAFSGDENLSNYREVTSNLKQMYEQRLNWMNSAIRNSNFPTDAK